jgi:signal transduction histidine kinase
VTEVRDRRDGGAPTDDGTGDRGRSFLHTLFAVGVAAALLTLLISVVPSVRFAYRSEAAHAALETAVIMIAGLAAALITGRAMRNGSRNEMLLAAALALLAGASVLFSLLPGLAEWSREFSTWGGVAARVIGAAMIAAAALLPERTLRDPARAARRAGIGVLAVLAASGVLAALFAGDIPTGIDPTLSPERADRPRLIGNAGVLGVQLLLIGLYVAATIGFARRALRRGDRLLRGFAISALLSAFARVNYLLFPSLYTEWVYTGDVLRLAQFLVILAFVVVELLEYQRRASIVAVLDERRRVARELHDGLAQELAYIRAEAQRLEAGGQDLDGLRSAASRALDESRVAIATLNRPLDEPLEETLRVSAEAVAFRADARVVTRSDGAPSVSPDVRHALSRIVREATSNAVRHGRAQTVTIAVRARGTLRVVVADDGSGFDVDGPVRDDAYGLVGMRERAEALGGRLHVESRPGDGTRVEVMLP